jgi:hypothetical protein
LHLTPSFKAGFFGQRVDDLFGALDLSLGGLNPNVLEDIGELAEPGCAIVFYIDAEQAKVCNLHGAQDL